MALALLQLDLKRVLFKGVLVDGGELQAHLASKLQGKGLKRGEQAWRTGLMNWPSELA